MKRYVLYVSVVCCVLLFTGTAAAVSPVETAHFRVVANGPGLQTADLKKVGEDVEGVYKQVSDTVGTGYTSSGKIEVRVYVTPEKGRALRTAASSSTIFLTFGRIDEGALKHELTHILISKPLSTAPRWFHEGLAMYVEYGSMRGAYKKALPPFKGFSFTRLEAKFGADKTEQSSYLYAWAIVSDVMDTCGKDKLKDIYKEHGSFSDKFSKGFGVDLRSIEKKADGIFAEYK
jgi:hypothetical protein